MKFFVTEDFSGSDLELCGPTIRQLPGWGRCHKRNWGNVRPIPFRHGLCAARGGDGVKKLLIRLASALTTNRFSQICLLRAAQLADYLKRMMEPSRQEPCRFLSWVGRLTLVISALGIRRIKSCTI